MPIARQNGPVHPDVEYAEHDGVHLAYKVLGGGPIDVVFVPMWMSNLDVMFEHPIIVKAFERLTRWARVIVFDRRGTGLSDRLGGIATLEEGMDDLVAVMDAAEVEQASLFGFNESGTLCMLSAATHPQRVRSLALYGTFPTTTWQPDYPWGQTPDDRQAQIDFMVQTWGRAAGFAVVAAQDEDQDFYRWAARWQRGSVTLDALPEVFERLAETDVRHVLDSINVPTLILHRKDDPVVPVENGRYLAEKIQGSHYVELEGNKHIPFLGDWEAMVDEVEEFLTGSRRPRDTTRVLATILFTDIVGSTEHASAMGDAEWKGVLEKYDSMTRRLVDEFDGRVVKDLGDGHLVTFDGPQRALKAACRINREAKGLGIELRSGLHTGEVEVRKDDLGGIAVHIGSRVMGLAGGGQVLVSESIPPLVAGSGIAFEEQGVHELKGVQGRWRVFSVDL